MVIKTYQEFIKEDGIDFRQGSTKLDLADNSVIENINDMLNTAFTDVPQLTPHIAYEKARQILVNFGINVPGQQFMDMESGDFSTELIQYDKEAGFKTDDYTKFLYFAWETNDEGTYDIFTEILTTEELELVLSDGEDSEETEDETE